MYEKLNFVYVADPGRIREFEALALFEKKVFLLLVPRLGSHTFRVLPRSLGAHTDASRVARHRARGHG